MASKKKKNMLNLYIVLGLIGGILIAVSIYGYRKESVKINTKRANTAKEDRENISRKIDSSTKDLKKNIIVGEETITTEIKSGISDLIKSQEAKSEIIEKEIMAIRAKAKKDRSLNTARFYAQLKLVPFDIKNPSFNIKYLFHNYGKNHAKKFNAQLHFIPSDYSDYGVAIISSATEIAPKLSLGNTSKIADFTILNNQIPIFFYIDLSFYDEIADKKINQEFYFKWMGINNGNYSNSIEVVQEGDIKNLREYIDNKINI